MVHPLTSVLPGQKLVSIGIASPFLVQMKMAAMAAFVVSLPCTLYQAWAFVAPGLYVHEKKMVLPLVVSSTVLFFCGMAFAYYVVFQTVFGFFVIACPGFDDMATRFRPVPQLYPRHVPVVWRDL